MEIITPLVTTLELTNKCNLRCRYCYGNCNIKKNKFISNPVSLLSDLDNKGVYGVELSGGEPLLHPRIYDIFEYIINHFEIKAIITNGTLLKEEHLKILEKNKRGKISIQISLDGCNKNSVDRTVGVKGAFENIIKGINLIKKYELPFRVGMVVDHPDKIDEIEDTLLLARNLGANLFIASPLIRYGRGRIMAENFLPEDNIRLFDEIQRMHGKYKGFFQTIEDIESIEKSKNCGAGSRNITVDVNGDLKPCPASIFNIHIGKWNDLYTEKVQDKLKLF